jgi:hypothetical protein
MGGDSEKVENVRRILPDAEFAPWEKLESALAESWKRGREDPIVPTSILAGYSGTPLPKKLGIKAGTRVVLSKAPEGFSGTLGELPEGSRLLTRFGSGKDLILWFVRSRAELAQDIGKWAPRCGKGGMWILWPKKAGPMESDLTQADVRRTGLDNGLVDFKICSVDEVWSGLKFSVRKV